MRAKYSIYETIGLIYRILLEELDDIMGVCGIVLVRFTLLVSFPIILPPIPYKKLLPGTTRRTMAYSIKNDEMNLKTQQRSIINLSTNDNK